MDLVALGLSLRSASLPALEALSGPGRLERAETRIRALAGVRETVRIVTCQRALLLLGVSNPLQNASSVAGSVPSASHRRGGPAHFFPDASLDSARRMLAEAAGIEGSEDEGAIVVLRGDDAFRHLVRLACGLESPLEGETEILGQLRAAYAAAVERGDAGRITGAAMHHAFRAARRIRARAGVPSASPSWGEFLAETIVSVSGVSHEDSLRIIGSGALSRSLTSSFAARGIPVTNDRSARRRGGSRSDAGGPRVLVTVSGRGRILAAADLGLPLASALPPRDGAAVLEIWDLGMPRNVDPEVATLPGVRVRTLADIPALAASAAARSLSRGAAEAMVEDEVAAWSEWRRERGSARTMVRLGRLLELSSGDFRRNLLGAFASIAADARDEDEAASRLALFEDALRRATSAAGSATPATADPAVKGRTRSALAGTVSLVGAGPGSGGLLTLEGARRLAEADVVYHDALAGTEVLAHCRPGARLVPVGKRRGRASAGQDEIEAALVRDARAGLAVVRLKGGDPFVFGRGGEEALALRRAGIPCDVVPGVSSGIAAPALAGIPVTHRGLSGSAAFVTAHDLGEGAEGEERRARLAHLAHGAETLVIFMAGAELARVRCTLQEAGLADETPAALIESGATVSQRVALGVLGRLEELAVGLGGGPVLIVVGRTVSLAGVLGNVGLDRRSVVVPRGQRAVVVPRGQRAAVVPRGQRAAPMESDQESRGNGRRAG